MNDYEEEDLVPDRPLTAKSEPVLAELWDNEDDAIYDSPEWQAAEREADEDIKAGRLKTFSSIEELLEDLDN
jgi:hypothetical protein